MKGNWSIRTILILLVSAIALAVLWLSPVYSGRWRILLTALLIAAIAFDLLCPAEFRKKHILLINVLNFAMWACAAIYLFNRTSLWFW